MLRFLILLFLFTYQMHSQNRAAQIDSLLQLTKTQKNDDLISTMNEISWKCINSSADSSVLWARKAINLSKSLKNEKKLASSYNTLATCFQSIGKHDSAATYHQKSLGIKLKLKDSIGIADTYNNLGIVYDEKADYQKALEHYFKALKIYENNSDDFQKVPMVYSNIGIVYKKQKEYKKTLLYYQKALRVYEENNYEIGRTITKGNIGAVLLKTKQFKESLKYSAEAKSSYEKLGYTRYIPYMLINTAIANDSLRNYTRAEKFYIEAIAMFEEDDNLFELAHAKIGFASNLRQKKDFKSSLTQLESALEIAQSSGFRELEIQALEGFSKTKFALGDYKEAYKFSERLLVLKDTLFKAEKTKAVLELESKYETKKKENQILQQRAQLSEKDLEVRRKNTFIYGSLGFAVTLGLIGFLFYSQQKLKNRQLQKEGELKSALSKIETQNKLQEQRLRISRDLHDNIGAQLTFIISSIDNLKFGFTDISEKLDNKLTNISTFTSQTIYELRDTIWAMNKENISFEDLQARIANFIKQAKNASELTEFSFNIDESVNDAHIFTSVEGINIYRIIQEAVNNSLKYAAADKIEVNISKEKSHYLIEISDNGTGFDQTLVEMGNGLNNIKKRAREIGASIDIVSKPNKGTKIILDFVEKARINSFT